MAGTKLGKKEIEQLLMEGWTRARTNWIYVPEIEEYISKLMELGDNIIIDKMEIPGVSFTAMGLDPEGNQVAMLEPKM